MEIRMSIFTVIAMPGQLCGTTLSSQALGSSLGSFFFFFFPYSMSTFFFFYPLKDDFAGFGFFS